MERLKQFIELLKNHYEKIILSVILLALLAAAAYLPYRVSRNRAVIREIMETGSRAPKKSPEPVELEPYKEAIQRVGKEPQLELSGEHNVFNPHLWKRSPDGRLVKIEKGDEEGPGGLAVTAIRPLYLTITFEGAQARNESIRYHFVVVDETAKSSRRANRFVSLNSPAKGDPFLLTKVNGPPEKPESLEVRFTDSAETATINQEQPYRRVAGYEADLVHRLGPKFNDARAKQPGGIRLANESYNIVAINPDGVTIESTKTSKRWTIRLKSAP